MSGLVTKQNGRNVLKFIESLNNDSKIEDSKILLSLIQEITGREPMMWGNEKVPDFIIGFNDCLFEFRYQFRRSTSFSTREV